MKFIITVMVLIATVFGQSEGGGVGKSTWAASAPRRCAAWFKKYLPADEDGSSCVDGKCECATQGRYLLRGQNFGVHTNNCTYHPYGEHSIRDIELKIQAEWGDFTKYHPFMDYNLGLYVHKLAEYIDMFEKDEVNYVALKWKSDDDMDYYSVLVNPCGFVVIELIGPHIIEKWARKFKEVDQLRFSFKSRNNKPSGGPDLMAHPLKISRATSRIEEVKKWYNKDIGVELLVNHNGTDGSETAIFMYDQPKDGMQLTFIQGRPVDHDMIEIKDSLNNTFSPKMWEDYMLSVHREIIQPGGVCGFDQWMDNHYGYSGVRGQESKYNLDTYVDNAKKLGYPYHWWMAGQAQAYIVDPTGFSVQFTGKTTKATKTIPTYGANCKSNDGCAGQGICKPVDMFFLQ